jgi:hypothetical protein
MEFIRTAESVDLRNAQISQAARDVHNIHIYGGERMPDVRVFFLIVTQPQTDVLRRL